jgi:hypothetical protein
MHKYCLLLIFFACFIGEIQAQRYNFPDSPSEYITFVSEQLKKTNRKELISLADNFSSAWSSSLSSYQKKIIETSKKMVAAKATMAGSYADFYFCLLNASTITKLSSAQINDFLEVCEKATVLKNVADYNNFLKRTKQFFENKAIEFTPVYRTYCPNNDFKIMFLGQVDEKLQNEFENKSDDSLSKSVRNLTGVLIKFNQTDFVLASKYDSLVGS